MKIWKCLVIGLAVCLGSCTGSKSESAGSSEAMEGSSVTSADIHGQWMIENVVENDSSYVRPSEIAPDAVAYIDFKDDSTFGVMTGCNHLGGRYSQSGDSLLLTDMSWTELACDHMELEDMLKKVLPLVRTIDTLNDSITRLNAVDAPTYIVLRKPSTPVK